MKCSLGISDFLEEISSLSHSIVFLYFFALETPVLFSIPGLGRSTGEGIGYPPTPVFLGFPCGSAGKESACNMGDLGLFPELGRSPGVRKGYPLQYSGWENSMVCIVHGIPKSWTWLSDFHFHRNIHKHIKYSFARLSIYILLTDRRKKYPFLWVNNNFLK